MYNKLEWAGASVGKLGIWKLGRGSLKTKKTFPRIGGAEKETFHFVILLGSGSARNTAFKICGFVYFIFHQFWEFLSHVSSNVPLHLLYFLLLRLKIDALFLILCYVSINLPFTFSISLFLNTPWSVTSLYLSFISLILSSVVSNMFSPLFNF